MNVDGDEGKEEKYENGCFRVFLIPTYLSTKWTVFIPPYCTCKLPTYLPIKPSLS